MKQTKIEWCDCTINPVVGCTYGCKYCYARKMNNRFKWVEDFSSPQFFPERLKQLKYKVPKVIFMDSMSDIADWKPEWANQVIAEMQKNDQHKYLFLSKRPQRYGDVLYRSPLDYRFNWWFGATVTDTESMQKTGYELYTATSADQKHRANRFLSIEPLHNGFDEFALNNLIYVDWVIIGAETGNRKGKVVPKKEWVTDIITTCKLSGVPVFMKDSLIPVVGEENMRRDFPWEVSP